MDKHFISANDLLKDSFTLAAKIYNSGFKPEFMIGVWRGGSPIAIAVNEFFEYMNISTDHISIRAKSYSDIGQQDKEIRLDGFEYIKQQLDPEKPVLIVDDVYDSGRSIKAIIHELESMFGQKISNQIRVAVPWYKPSYNKTDRTPDYFLHQTDKWLVFPHELIGLTPDEIRNNKDIKESTLRLFLEKHGI
jgi:hypoxanthine phosphoribosyltransferase